MHRPTWDADLDELEPLPALAVRRVCGTRFCRRTARPGGRHCPSCHAGTVRRWRERHRTELAGRRQIALAGRDEATRVRDSARAKLAMALRRRKLERGLCVVCGRAEVTALMDDPGRPLEVEWVCRADRQALLERRQERADERVAAAARAALAEERLAVLAAVELLPPDEQRRLKALAAQGPAGMQLSPGAPLYVMNLVRLFRSRL